VSRNISIAHQSAMTDAHGINLGTMTEVYDGDTIATTTIPIYGERRYSVRPVGGAKLQVDQPGLGLGRSFNIPDAFPSCRGNDCWQEVLPDDGGDGWQEVTETTTTYDGDCPSDGGECAGP